jgi:hypothetical protein
MARPRKLKPEQIRNKYVKVSLNAAEYAKVKATQTQKQTAAWMREALLSVEPDPDTPTWASRKAVTVTVKGDPELLQVLKITRRMLGKVGVNVNQCAKGLNSKAALSDELLIQLIDAQRNIVTVTNAISQCLQGVQLDSHDE